MVCFNFNSLFYILYFLFYFMVLIETLGTVPIVVVDDNKYSDITIAPSISNSQISFEIALKQVQEVDTSKSIIIIIFFVFVLSFIFLIND